eukprot:CAMPEP_0177649398 /NCGR_PEP_ID=MMETSP0447-20121125/11362_1 /TAXON_ID=0 /ORGANISM="Stygamoeba regulata, Strain BSH-02190019" /LENGTH=364 /DNA_ID=CAMNT_0019152147 /DNA_START=175 /DNA_END=1269 /DNA_ORIENTATION=-
MRICFFLTIVLVALLHGANAQHDHGSASSASGSGAMEHCVMMPTDPDCMHYTMPPQMVEQDITNLCNAMPFMVGCSVRDYCLDNEANADVSGSPYCADFSILRDLCLDMPGMMGCMHYNSMCAPGSVVMECSTAHLPLARSMETAELLDEMCTSHNMPSCDQVRECEATGYSNCDLLDVYSSTCRSMPFMAECDSWRTMCDAVPDWDYCTVSGSDAPVMKMYFHTDERVYVLFESWVPSNAAAYAGTWFAIFFAGILLELLRAFRRFFEYMMAPSSCDCGEKRTVGNFFKEHPIQPMADVLRALLHFVDVALALLLMLVAMTFNVGLFFAVVSGACIGHLFVGRYISGHARGLQSAGGAGAACH